MNGKRTAAATAAVVTALGVIVHAARKSPAAEAPEPVPVIERLAPESESRTNGADSGNGGGPALDARRGDSGAFFLTLLAWIRVFLTFPLWVLGWMLLSGFFSRFPLPLPVRFPFRIRFPFRTDSPVFAFLRFALAVGILPRLAGWYLLGMAANATFRAVVRLACPSMFTVWGIRPPLSLLRTVWALAAADALFLAADGAGFPFWFRVWYGTLWRWGMLCLFLFVCAEETARAWRRARKRARRMRARRRKSEPLTRERIETLARRMADSVCPRRF